ncbi:MAG: T9SS type A sorting domain-containing protein [Bacteroidota bacterium]
MNRIIIIFLLFVMSSSIVAGQVSLSRDTTVKVLTTNGSVLKNGWSCGFNNPVFAEIDLNNDGTQDLIAFDGFSARLNCFVYSTNGYVYAPEYNSLFPQNLEGWVRTYDYDNDGDKDVFSYFAGGIRVDRNESTISSGLSFTNVTMQLNCNYSGTNPNLFVTRVDIPALTDIDNDGDMDILAFSINGSWIDLDKNLSMDSLGNNNQFKFHNVPGCWGYFYKEAVANKAVLPVNTSCALLPAHPFRMDQNNFDSGSAIWVEDLDGDGDQDFLCGDKVGRNLLKVENCGNADSAYACAQDTAYPSNTISASMREIASPYIFDYDKDGDRDLLVANFNSSGEDFNNTIYYENIGTSTSPNFNYVKNRLLIDEMIDAGTSSHPVFFDWDGDGLKDLLISNDGYYEGGSFVSKVAYYKNISQGANHKFQNINDSIINFRSLNIIGTRLAFGDLNNDGDQDMLVGDATGRLSYFQNIGTATNPNFIFSQGYYQNIDVGSDAAPQLVDVNRDGLLDMLIGERNGNINYYRNSGSISAPVFSFETDSFGKINVGLGTYGIGYSVPLLYDVNGNYELLVGSYKGALYHYNNVDGNLLGAFQLLDSTFQSIKEQTKSYPAMNDVDGDGKFDLVIGNQSGGVVLYTQNNNNSIAESQPENLTIKVYPNPVSDFLNIESIAGQKIDLYTLQGSLMHSFTIGSGLTKIDLSNLSSGVYYLKSTSNHVTKVVKL